MQYDQSSPAAAGSREGLPRVAILGEFSAGKSTLINLLTGQRTLRTQVTATQMPAAWISYGDQEPYCIDMEGNSLPVDLDKPDLIDPAKISCVRMFMRTPVLEICDLIDTPGNSDPNIPAEAWQRIADIADIAVWCTPSTQAWRQSERAAWNEVPASLRKRSVLLITRADMLSKQEDRQKVLKRVHTEAGPHFSAIHMASLRNFKNLHPFLRDLIELCGLPAGTRIPEEAPAEPERPAVSVIKPKPANTTAPSGPATGVWRQLTRNLQRDNTDELRKVTLEFLATMDRMLDDGSGKPGTATTLWKEMLRIRSKQTGTNANDFFRDFLIALDAQADSLPAQRRASGGAA